MKKTHKRLGQYFNENHNYEGSIDEFLEETAPVIGRVVHSFNSLDAQLNSSICSIINDRADEIGAVVIYKMTFSNKIELFFRLVKSIELAFGDTLPSFQKLIEDLKKCASLRNAVVHAEWENLDAEVYTYVKLNFDKDGMKQHYWQFTPDSLEDIEDFIFQTYDSFENYEDEMQKIFQR